MSASPSGGGRDLPTTADVVIVGGGVIGCSLACHLAREALRVVLLERETLGSQSTARCAGGVRQQFSAELNVRIQRYSVARLEHFEEEIGHALDFRQIGYLFLLTEAAQVASFQEQFQMWRRCGLLEARWLTAEDAQRLSPAIAVEDVLAATFCPSDGSREPGRRHRRLYRGRPAGGGHPARGLRGDRDRGRPRTRHRGPDHPRRGVDTARRQCGGPLGRDASRRWPASSCRSSPIPATSSSARRPPPSLATTR